MKEEIKTYQEWSSKDRKPEQWQHFLCTLFMPVSIPLLYLGVFIMNLSNFLMFDTHHMDVKVTPK